MTERAPNPDSVLNPASVQVFDAEPAPIPDPFVRRHRPNSTAPAFHRTAWSRALALTLDSLPRIVVWMITIAVAATLVMVASK